MIQIGPGIVTLNDTSKYKWPDFRDRSITTFKNLIDTHPDKNNFKVQNVVLRYLNAVEFDYKKKSVFNFLEKKMHTTFALPEDLFEGEGNDIEKIPEQFGWESSFLEEKINSMVTIRISSGQ